MGIQINGQTDRISAVDGSFSIQDLAEVNVTGVATASNFKTGTSNVHSTGYECTNINATGIVTAASANFTGNVSVGGTLTYQDVTNIDSVGIITARAGVKVPDSQTVFLGTDDDLRIFHDGSQNAINSYTSNPFNIISNGNTTIKTNNNESMAVFKKNSAVELYYDNVKKFETHADGLHIGDGGNLDMPHDSSKIVMGASDDLQIYHDGSHSYVKDAGTGELRLEADAGGVRIQRASGHTGIFYNVGGQVELYYDNTKRFETRSTGVQITGRIEINGTNGRIEYNNIANTFEFFTNNTKVAEFLSGGHFVPGTNNTFDLGSSSYRWRNIYTNDLNLSNEGSTNDVDGTWGNYTIQEGENDLYLINRRNGKKYKFNLTEVN